MGKQITLTEEQETAINQAARAYAGNLVANQNSLEFRCLYKGYRAALFHQLTGVGPDLEQIKTPEPKAGGLVNTQTKFKIFQT